MSTISSTNFPLHAWIAAQFSHTVRTDKWNSTYSALITNEQWHGWTSWFCYGHGWMSWLQFRHGWPWTDELAPAQTWMKWQFLLGHVISMNQRISFACLNHCATQALLEFDTYCANLSLCTLESLRNSCTVRIQPWHINTRKLAAALADVGIVGKCTLNCCWIL